jgi:hypothetical protein
MNNISAGGNGGNGGTSSTNATNGGKGGIGGNADTAGAFPTDVLTPPLGSVANNVVIKGTNGVNHNV